MRRSPFATILLLLATAPAAAEQVQLGTRFVTRYNDEVVSTGGGQDDFIFEFGPSIRISGEHPRMRYSIEHTSAYNLYQQLDEFSDWRHELYVNGSWDMMSRLRLSLANSFTSQPQLSTIEADPDETLLEDQVDTFGSNPVLTNSFSATLTATPTARFVAQAQVSNFYREYDDPSLSSQDVLSTTLVTQGFYQVLADHRLGAGFSLRTREFGATESDEGTGTTNIYQVFASWQWQIDERTTFSAQAGPAFSEDDFDDPEPISQFAHLPGSPELLANPFTCDRRGPNVFFGIAFVTTHLIDSSCEALPQRALTPAEVAQIAALGNPLVTQPEGRGQSNVDVFFGLSLQRQWDRVTAFADWTRSDSETQGLGSATIQDSLRAGLRYQPTRRWSASLTFRFTRRFTDLEEAIIGLPIAVDAVLPIVFLSGVSGAAVVLTTAQQPFENTDDIYHLQLRLGREWGRYSTIFAGVDLYQQNTESKTDLNTFRSEDRHFRFEVGFNYRFRPIRF